MSPYGSIQGDIAKASNGHSTNGERTPLVANGIEKVDEQAGRFVTTPPTHRSFWSKLTFQWFTPVLHQVNEKKKLDQEDLELVPMPLDCTTEAVCARFDTFWRKELASPDPSLVRALCQAFAAEFFTAGLLKITHDLCVFVGPNVLHAMVVFLRNPEAPLWHGLGLTLSVTLSQLIMSICLRHYFYKCYITGLRVRTAIVVVVYRKALMLSSSERQTRSLGEITNLMSIDAQRLQGEEAESNSQMLRCSFFAAFLMRHLIVV
jgi:hypothetical protein